MMSIGAALSAATTFVGHALPDGRAWERTTRDVAAGVAGETRLHGATFSEATFLETTPEEATLLVAIEAGLREAGYLAN